MSAKQLDRPTSIWKDGAVVPWNTATVHVWSDAFQRAASVFEGIRGYWDGSTRRYFFLAWDAHMKRLAQSARLAAIEQPHQPNDLFAHTIALLEDLGYEEDVYIRPTFYQPDSDAPPGAGCFIPIFQSPRSPTIEKGVTCMISTWRRPHDTDVPPRVKAAANYYASRLGRLEAQSSGHDEALFLNRDGRVAETGGAAVFSVRDGVVSTPSITESVLESITRTLVIELLRAEGVPVSERPLDRTELYIADEIFLAGTLAEITPVTRIDRFDVGQGVRGPLTAALQASYSRLCHGALPGFERWTTPLSVG